MSKQEVFIKINLSNLNYWRKFICRTHAKPIPIKNWWYSLKKCLLLQWQKWFSRLSGNISTGESYPERYLLATGSEKLEQINQEERVTRCWLSNTVQSIYCTWLQFLRTGFLYFKFKAYLVYIIYLLSEESLLDASGTSWKLMTNEINRDYSEVLTFPDDRSTPSR